MTCSILLEVGVGDWERQVPVATSLGLVQTSASQMLVAWNGIRVGGKSENTAADSKGGRWDHTNQRTPWDADSE